MIGIRARFWISIWCGAGLILLAILIAPSGAHAASGPWILPATSLSDPGVAATPKVDGGPDGVAVTTWSLETGESSRIKARVRNGDNLGPIVTLSAADREVSLPEVAVGPSGHLAAVWKEKNAEGDWLVAASTGTVVGGFGPAVVLSTAGGDADRPQVDVASDGTVAVTWFRFDGDNNRVQARIQPPGGTFGPVVDLSDAGGEGVAPEPVFALDGTLAIAWQRSNGTHFLIQAKVRPPGGTFGELKSISAGGSDAYFAQVSASSDGTFNFVWLRQTLGEFLIQSRSLAPDGILSTIFAVSSGTNASGEPQSGNAFDSQIATGADGTTAYVWQRVLEPNRYVIQARIRSASGTFGPIIDLSARGVEVEMPKVIVGPDGTVTAAWPQASESGSAVLVRTLSPDGASTFPVPLSTDEVPGIEPSLAIDSEGAAFAAWTGERDTGNTIEFASNWVKGPDEDPGEDPVCEQLKLSFGKLTPNRKKGTATLVVRINDTGKLILKGTGSVKGQQRTVGSSGKATVSIRLRGKALKKVKKRGKVQVRLQFTFKPQDGCPSLSKSRQAKLVKRK